MNKNVTVVDSMMGTGKTTAMINKMIADESHNYIFVTIYKTEIQRVIEATQGRFCEPENYGDGKLDDLHKKLRLSKDIATTHALLLRANDETIKLIKDGNYILVLDEVLNVIQEYNEVAVNNYFDMETPQRTLNKRSVIQSLENDFIKVDPESLVVTYSWNMSSGTDSELLDLLSKKGVLRCSTDTLLVEYPIEVFDAFSEIYILTYMYEHSILAAYFKKYQYEVKLISAKNCELVDWYDDAEGRREIINLLKVYIGTANKIGAKDNAFSVTWLQAAMKDDTVSKKILAAMTTFKTNVKAVKEFTMVTTSKDDSIYSHFQKAGYAGHTVPAAVIDNAILSSTDERNKWNASIRYYEEKINSGDTLDSVEAQEYRMLLEMGEPHISSEKEFEIFVSCTARATNMYRNRRFLMYMINRYLPVDIYNYFLHFGIAINQEMWAVSEFLQWAFRSQIRDGKPVDIFIPSSRMRKAYFEWGGLTEAEYIRDVLGISSYRSLMRTYEVSAEDNKKGRPLIDLPPNWNDIMEQLMAKKITAKKAMELTGLKKDKFYEFKKQYEAERGE